MSKIMPGLIGLVGLLVGLGLLHLFARDLVWALTQWRNVLTGRSSERTVSWDTWQAGIGIGLIVVGVGVGLLGRHAATTEVETAVVTRQLILTERAPVADRLDRTFAELIPLLEATASIQPTRVTAAALGLALESTELDYGRCPTSDDFYMVALNYVDGETYAYTGSDGLCPLDHLRRLTGDVQYVGASVAGGAWYVLTRTVETVSNAEGTEKPLM